MTVLTGGVDTPLIYPFFSFGANVYDDVSNTLDSGPDVHAISAVQSLINVNITSIEIDVEWSWPRGRDYL